MHQAGTKSRGLNKTRTRGLQTWLSAKAVRIEKQQQTTGLIQRLSNNIQLLSIGVIVSEKFGFRKCLFVVYKFALHGQQFSCQTGKGNRLKHRQFSQDVPVWRMVSMRDFK